jgi:glycosyltransferase involved in cell wall biosynthesis
VKKILFCSEAHYLTTGYAVVYKEFLKTFHNSGKFEVAELASYGKVGAAELKDCPWKFYANSVDKNHPHYSSYEAAEIHKYGSWRFEKVLLDFKPDVVIGLRDIYMDSFIVNSPLADYVYKILVPPTDSMPQLDEWLDYMTKADAIFTHTKWAYDELKNVIPKANIVDVLSFGVDTDIFKPMDKTAIRNEFGISPDITIFGSIMRNMPRKLFPNLINGFAKFINSTDPAVAAKCFLYLHTAYPDKEPWNIPKLLKLSGISSKVITSYICRACNHTFSSIFQDGKTICPQCNNISALTPNPGTGFSREQLAKVYNLFDCYFQVSSAEGGGIPPIEAASCGVPIASMDFGPMGEVVNNLGGFKIRPSVKFFDFKNQSYRYLADEDHIAQIMADFVKNGVNTSIEHTNRVIQELYSWSKICKKLLDYVDGLTLTNRWDEPAKLHNIPSSFPANISDPDFIDFLADEVLGDPDAKYEYLLKAMEHELFLGTYLTKDGPENLTKEVLFNLVRGIAEKKRLYEEIRQGYRPLIMEDFMEFANK